MKFNWLDIALILSGLWGFYMGFRRGILGELVLIAGCIASLVTAVFMSPWVWQKITSQFSLDFELSNSTVMWMIITLGFILSLILAKIVQALSHLVFQSKIDKGIGGLLGTARAIGLAGVLIAFLVFLHVEFVMKHAQESVIASYLTQKVNEAHEYLKQKITPSEVEKAVNEIGETEGAVEQVEEVQNLEESKVTEDLEQTTESSDQKTE
jgi:uncharacterized membrane protein required for colicin V production